MSTEFRRNELLAAVGITTPANLLVSTLDRKNPRYHQNHAATIALVEAAERVRRAESKLLELGAQLKNDVDSVDHRLQRMAYDSVNSLGELQGTAQRYDLTCADLNNAWKGLHTMAQLYTTLVSPQPVDTPR